MQNRVLTMHWLFLTADRLAKIHEATLEFICVLETNTEKLQQQAKVDYVDQLKDICATPATVKVVTGIDELTEIEKVTPDYDLLVMGAPSDRSRLSQFLGSPKDKLTQRADCSVLWLKTARNPGSHFDRGNRDSERRLPWPRRCNGTRVFTGPGRDLPQRRIVSRCGGNVFQALSRHQFGRDWCGIVGARTNAEHFPRSNRDGFAACHPFTSPRGPNFRGHHYDEKHQLIMEPVIRQSWMCLSLRWVPHVIGRCTLKSFLTFQN